MRCHLCPVFVGALGGLLMMAKQSVEEHWRVDNALGAILVYLSTEVSGRLAVALFGYIDTVVHNSGLVWTEQLSRAEWSPLGRLSRC